MAGKERGRREKGTGSIYKRTWKNKKGEVIEGKTWWIKYYKRGRAYQEGTKFTDKSNAQKLLNKRVHEIHRDGKLGVHFDKFRFEDLVRLFVIDRMNERGANSIKEAKKRIIPLRKVFRRKRVTDITSSMVNSYISKRKRDGLANATINRELAGLRRMLNLGKDHQPPKVNIATMPKIKMLKEDNVKEGFIEREDYLRLLESLPQYLRAPTTFAYHTGWREEEIFPLEWDRVNLKKGTIRLSPSQVKEKSIRDLYLEGTLIKLLGIQNLSRRKNCKYVFHKDGKRVGIRAGVHDIRYDWNRACREVGLGYGYKVKPKYSEK